MTKSNSRLERNLRALNALERDPSLEENPPSDGVITALRKALSSKNNHVVARAAQIVGNYEIEALTIDLAQAFERFMDNPTKRDPGCRAKLAIAESLYRLDYREECVFLTGIHHVQMEPTYGGKVDTAAALRGMCALGLVRMNYPDVMVELAQLLADPESDARIAAARALAYAHQEASFSLLHFKILVGDPHPQVLCECFTALLKLAPKASLPFVAHYLNDEDNAVCEAAALALGETRPPGAFEVLRQAWEKTLDSALKRTELLALAMLRDKQALDFLLSLVAEASLPNARAALTALDMYQHDAKLWERVEACLDARPELER